MAIFLIDLPPSDMERRLGDALTVYVDAMRYPRGTETLRAPMWLEHIRRRGWQAVAAVEVTAAEQAEAADTTALPSAAELSNAPMLGVAYGYPGAPGQWWQQQVVLGLQRSGFPRLAIARLMTSYFELTELHILPALKAVASGRRWPADCQPVATRTTSCSPHRRPTVRTIGRGGCTAGWASPTSSAATTSPVTPEHSPSWVARYRSNPRPTACRRGMPGLAR